VIVMVSKPPDPHVAASLLAAARHCGKPTVINFIGYAAPTHKFGNLYFAQTLQEAAELAVHLLGEQQPTPAKGLTQPMQGERKFIRGLFSGGTLAIEAVHGLEAFIGSVHTNISGTTAATLADPLVSQGHTILDLGEDIFTVGRLHPMIDNDLRLRRLRQEASDPQVALILLDVVLGEGAHPDPASELGPAINQVLKEFDIAIAALLIGTDDDPQDLTRQRETLEAAGAMVFNETGSLLLYATQLMGDAAAEQAPRVSLERLNTPIAAINVGLESFFDSLKAQGAEVVQVDWRPPASGNERLMDILSKMKSAGTPQDKK
jgi:FdrA protein